MKKSFMTRILATGLSFAMAFSMAAATNVTTASAAAKQASVTSMMKVASKTVTEGKKVTTYMNSSAAKKYRIKSHTESAVTKKYISVVMTSSRKGLTITAKEGALAAANLEKKGVYTKINFAPAKSVAAVKKAAATKYVKLKVVVKAAEKPVEKQAIVSAQATGVKTITLTMAKEVASVASPVSITVKKGVSEKAQTATADGKTITLAMDNKLMSGDYVITIKGLESEDLTATATVEKDEYLKGYKISAEASLAPIVKTENGKTTSTASSQTAIVMYYALNQYDEPMLADEPNATSSFSSNTKVTKVATASQPGEITIDEIPAVLAIPGTSKGTMTLVDKSKGTNTTSDITISNMRSPKNVEVAGTYNINKNVIEDIRENAKIANYYILLTATDQYGWPVKEFNDDITINISGGLTNIGLNSTTTTQTTKTVVVDGKEYIAIVLKGVNTSVAQQGSYLVTIVNDKVGMLLNATYEVKEDVIAKSISITADKGLYVGEKNELSYEVVDTNGNSITDYETLISIPVSFDTVTINGNNAYFSWVKQKDGSAKLIADMTNISDSDMGFNDSKQFTQSTILSVVSKMNTTTGGNYLVTPFQLTAKKARVIVAAKGVKADQALNFAIGQSLNIGYKSLTFVDQYSNTITSDDDDQFIKKTAITAGALKLHDVGLSYKIVSNDAVFSTATWGAIDDTVGFKFEGKGGTKAGTAVIYLKYAKGTEESAVEASEQSYDARIIVSAVDTSAKESLKIDSINGGNVVSVDGPSSKGAITKSAIVVVSEVGGSKTVIPMDQYDLIDGDSATFTEAEIKSGVKTKTVTAKVLVTTWGKNGTEVHTTLTADYKVSWDGKSVNKIDGVNKGVISTVPTGEDGSKVATNGAFAGFFNFKDQYGTVTNGAYAISNGAMWAGNVKYTVTVKNSNADAYKIVSNGENAIRMTATSSGAIFEVEVTAEVNGASKTVDGKIQF